MVLIKVLQLLLCFSILVFVHELGHFLFARLFKTRVEKFYLFFPVGFSLFKFKKGDTEYGMGWLPLGGYVKISGMIDESMDVDQMKSEPQPWEFRTKPAWQRLLIMAAGVIMNVVFAFIVYIGVLFTWGDSYLPMKNVPNGVATNPTFKEIGIENGDLIVALDTQKIDRFYSVIPDILLNDPKTITVNREGRLLTFDVPEELKATLLRASSKRNGSSEVMLHPRQMMDSMFIYKFPDHSKAYDAGMRENDRILSVNGLHFQFYDQFREFLDTLDNYKVTATVLREKDTLLFNFRLSNDGKFGVYFGSTERLEFENIKYGFFEAIPAGINRGLVNIKDYLKQLRLLFTPKAEAYKSVGGVISIGDIFPGVWDWHSFWNLTAFISIMLAIVNLLPIPALDGGHILFLLYEVITRRKPGLKFMEIAQIVGMFIILMLFILAMFNDITKFL